LEKTAEESGHVSFTFPSSKYDQMGAISGRAYLDQFQSDESEGEGQLFMPNR
jgi:hypothetical protein